MNDEVKVSDLPANALHACATELAAALSRQDAQPAQHDEVDFYVCTNCDTYYRDSPVSECDCAVGARDFRHVRMAPVTQPEQQEGGRVIGSRNIDGVHVIVVSSFSGLADEQLFVRHDDYLAAQRAQPEQQGDGMCYCQEGVVCPTREQQGAGDYHIAMLRELLANEFADQDEEGATRFTSERAALNAAIRALAARQPVGQASPELFAAARDFYNETVGDPNVRISCESPEQRDVVTAAGERLRAALVSPPAQAVPDEQYADEQALIDHLDSLMDDGGQGGDKWEPAQAAIRWIIAARQTGSLAETLQHYMRDESDKLPDAVFKLPQEAQRALVTLSGMAASPMRIHPRDAKEAVAYVVAAILESARQPVGQRYRFVDGSAGGLMIEDAEGEWVRCAAIKGVSNG